MPEIGSRPGIRREILIQIMLQMRVMSALFRWQKLQMIQELYRAEEGSD